MANESLRGSVLAELGSVAGVARALSSPLEAPRLRAGAVVGDHFEIAELVGQGGMSAVYRARDLRLGRWVAIKLKLDGTDVERARREATALARVSHPNVVTIYEIFDHHGIPAVVMELCEGGSVGTWLRAGRRSWREVLDVFLAAGRGLVAAHAAGLIHRDVKPDNLLLAGGGRVVVADFGLAREVLDAPEPAAPAPKRRSDQASAPAAAPADDSDEAQRRAPSAASAGGEPRADEVTASQRQPAVGAVDAVGAVGAVGALTADGTVLGTLHYMAPEQLAGERVDERTDQFGFALSLYEALCEVELFPGPLPLRLAAIAAGDLAPARRSVPRRVVAPLVRALAASPQERWPTLDALLARLARARRSRWPAVALAGATVAAAAALLWPSVDTPPAAPRVEQARADDDPCAGLPRDLGALWSATARAAFLAGAVRAPTRVASAAPPGATAPSAAPPTAERVAQLLDQLATSWARSRQTLCQDLPRTPQWSAALGAAGRTCLEARRAELARIAALRDLPVGALAGSVVALPDPGACSQPKALALEPLDDEATRVAIAAAEIDLLTQTGHREAVDRARALLATVPVAASPAARGYAAQTLGRALAAQGDLRGAAPHLHDAFLALRAAGLPAAFETAMLLADALVRAGEAAAAAEWLDHARAEAGRLELRQISRARLDLLSARVAEASGNLGQALVDAERALGLARSCDSLRCQLAAAEILSSRAIFHSDRGEYQASLTDARAAVADMTALFGPDYPALIDTLWTAGLAEVELGRIDDALATLTRARRLAESALPSDALPLAYSLWNEAVALGHRDRAAARPLFDRALAIVEAQLGPRSDDARALRADRQKWSVPLSARPARGSR